MSAVTEPGTSEYRKQLQEAAAFIRSYDQFLVVSHVQPDGDAAGSTFAAGHMLQQLGKRFTLINESELPEKFAFLSGGLPIHKAVDLEKIGYEAVISVDCADFSRLGEVGSGLAPDVPLLNIDHHATNTRFGTCLLVKEDAAATAEVLYDLADALGLKLNEAANRCLYAGLLTDTGGFRYANTTEKVMRIAGRLLETGVPGYELAERLLERLTIAQVTLLKRALATLSFDSDNRISWLTVTLDDLKSCGANSDDLDGLVNYPRNIEGVRVGMLFKESDKGGVKASLRSDGSVDVSAIAAELGGGGHKRAAGVTLSLPMAEAVRTVIERTKEQL